MKGIAIFVSAVAGRLASRPGSPHAYIGARLTTAEEQAAGADIAVWDEKQIVAVPDQDYYGANTLSWMKLIRNGDVLERTEKDFKAYTQALAATEKKRDERLAEEAKQRAEAEAEATKAAKQKAAEESALPGPAADGNLPPADSSLKESAGTGVVGNAVEAKADGSMATLVAEGSGGGKPARKEGK